MLDSDNKLQINLMKTKLILILSLIFVVGCGSNGAERKPAKPRNFISYEEIQTITTATTAQDLVELARPIWLRPKGIEPQVYMNNIQMGGVESLENVSVNSIQEVRYLSPTEATTMFGTNNMGGVISIKSR